MKKKYRLKEVIAVLCLCLCSVFLSLVLKENIGAKKEFSMIFIPKTMDENNDFWRPLINGAIMSAEEYGINIEVVAPEKEIEYEKQIEMIEWAIEQAPDAIMVAPSSYSETTEVLQKVKEKGIVLVLIDSVIDVDIADAVVSTDNVSAGLELGKLAANYLTEGDEIGIVGHVKEASTAIEREKGVRVGLGELKSCITEVVFCDSSYIKAYELTVEMLENNPEIDMIIGLNEYSALGAGRAVSDKGLDGKVKVIGFDSSLEQIQLMEKGVFQGIVIQRPFNMGYLGVKVVNSILYGDEVDKITDSGSKIITLENLYEEENQKLLFPFNEK